MSKRRNLTSFEVMIKRVFPEEFYDIPGEPWERSLRSLLLDYDLMKKFVETCPNEAFSLYNRAVDWRHDGDDNSSDIELFLGTDVRVGKLFVDCYKGDTEYGVCAECVDRSMKNKEMDGRPKEAGDRSGVPREIKRGGSGYRGRNNSPL